MPSRETEQAQIQETLESDGWPFIEAILLKRLRRALKDCTTASYPGAQTEFYTIRTLISEIYKAAGLEPTGLLMTTLDVLA